MRKIFISLVLSPLFVLLFAVAPVYAADYYFDATNGNDATGDGSQGNPYKTLSKLDTLTLNGDIVHLKRGETWYESTTPNITGAVTFDAYGTDINLPVISGEEIYPAAGWTQSANGEYYRTVSSEPSTVWQNGTTQLNCSSMDIQTDSNGDYNVSVEGTPIKVVYDVDALQPMTQVSPTGSWPELVCPPLNAGQWCLSDALRVKTTGSRHVKAMTTKAGELDAGACFYDPKYHNLYVKLINGAPSNGEISASVRNGMTVTDVSNVAVKNIEFYKSKSYSFAFNATSNQDHIAIDGVESYYSGRYGFIFNVPAAYQISDITIQNYRIENNARFRRFDNFGAEQLGGTGAIDLATKPNFATDGLGYGGSVSGTIKNGIITRDQGYALSQPPDYRNGIFINKTHGSGMLIENNEISYVGAGIYFFGSSADSSYTIRNNYIHHTEVFGIRIQTIGTGPKLIHHNVIAYPGYNLAPNFSRECIQAANVELYNNTCINPHKGGFDIYGESIVKNNIIQIAAADSEYGIICPDNPLTGTFSNNIYYDSFGSFTDLFHVGGDNCVGGVYYDFAEWCALTEGVTCTSSNADPQFASVQDNDFHPIAGSPACTMSDTGSYVGALHCYISNDWQYRQKITIDSGMTTDNLSSFPVLVKITNQGNPVFSNARADGADIVFTGTDGVMLDYEIELYQNNGTKELDAWVKVPALSSTADTVIYMYYGNSSAPNQENPAGVWDSDSLVVQHLSETSGQHLDSTANNNDSCDNINDCVNNPGVHVTGQGVPCIIGGCDEFGADNYVSIPDGGVDSPLDLSGGGSITLSAWIYATGVGEYPGNQQGIIAKGPHYDSRGYTLRIDGHNCNEYGDYTVMGTRAGNWGGICGTRNNIAPNSWEHVVYVYDSATFNHYLYINGIQNRTNNFSANAYDSLNDLRIGEWAGVSFDGFIDEVEISTTARSAAWVKTSYENQNSPDSYLTLGVQENQ